MRIILISSYFRAKKDCLLWEDNTSDTFHLFNRLKFSLFFRCPEGAISQLDTSSEDCNFFTEDCRTVTSLLFYFNQNLPLEWHLEATFYLPVTSQSQPQVPYSRALSWVISLFKHWIVPSEQHNAIGLFNAQPLSPSHPYQEHCLNLR